jgi:hypothetical protein
MSVILVDRIGDQRVRSVNNNNNGEVDLVFRFSISDPTRRASLTVRTASSEVSRVKSQRRPALALVAKSATRPEA